jgi:hypothetical protein
MRLFGLRESSRVKLRRLTLALLALAAVALARPALAAPPEPFDTLASLLAARVDGPEKRVLLLGLTDPDGAVTGLERYLTDRLAAALTATGRVSLTDETARQAALAEIHGNLADVIDRKTAQVAGRLAGAAWLLKGTAYVFGEARRTELHLQLVRTETGEYWQVAGPAPLDPAVLRLRQQRVVTPQAAPKRPPLQVEMAVVASRPDGRGGDVDLGVVREGARLRSNDDVKVYFRTNADAYVYLVWVGSQGKASLQFPTRAAGLDNRVRGGELHSAPEANKWIYLDRHAGIETLYLLASHEPLPDLGALLRQAESGGLLADPGGVRQAVEQLFADLQTRGAAGVHDGPTYTVTGKGAAVAAGFSLVRGYAQAVRRLSFHHDP